MPQGKGTYGSKLGRPGLGSRYGGKKENPKQSLRKKEKAKKVLKNLADKYKNLPTEKEPGYKKLSKYAEKSSPTLGKGGYQAESEKMNTSDARERRKKSY